MRALTSAMARAVAALAQRGLEEGEQFLSRLQSEWADPQGPYAAPWALFIVAANEIGWYVAVALLFSSRAAQATYRRAKRWIDRVTGAVMMIFGLRLILGVRS